MKKRTRLAGMTAAICWMVFGITLIILLTAGDGGYLGYQMLKYAPPEISRLPETEYPGMGDMTAGYLTGRTERFQYEFIDLSGKTVTCFHDYEEAHMADCRNLIRLDRFAMLISGGVLLVLGCSRIMMRRHADGWYRGILWGLRIAAAVAGGFLIWALADYDGLFVTFHRVTFWNDGWLLNPRTDLLIRLMPTEFFISLGVRGIWLALAAPAVLEIVARFGLKKLSGNREQ